ncbi:MAG: TIGR03960 family B12-binding radical SAM protein [Planctomycetes bacterium]|nr:TIGR03960 family B12-binding radical SAM protein [Planctomycetota bacterium]
MVFREGTMTLRERISDELLPYVKQPGQYIGGEWNQLVRTGDWERAEVKVAVGFPDAYTIGMSHLGCQIIYWVCNHMPGVCAERVYAPWLDAEQVMRQRGLPLFTWDTRQPVGEADVFAISLQYEMGFSNVLMMLDLAGIPLRAEDRTDAHPLVIGGGPQADNPEPVADFFDLVVIGDGEHSMTALVELYREMKRQGASRRDIILEAAGRFDWVYAPSLYAVDYHPEGTIAAVRPSSACPADFTPRMRIERCQTPDFETVGFPTRPIVPFTAVVHDRISIEVMRGCPQRCRFCHAGYTKRPVGVRSVDRILDIAEEAWRATGHEEIGLLSLSTADYPHLRELAERINARFAARHVNLSVPSLRVDKMLANIPWMVTSVRKSGLTVAVEAASDDMRAAIRKKVTDGNLLEGMKQAYAAGYNSVKLYFMCGFPGERERDITAIFTLAHEVSQAKRGVRGGPASVTASVGWLVPKPHTPFQWAAQKTLDYFEQARSLLRSTAMQHRSAVRVKTHKPQRSILEGVFARGDRRLAPTIEAAYRLGARMDGWDEAFNYDTWLRAFEQTGVDPAFYAHRERDYAEILPWDHLAGGGRREYLEGQYDDVFIKLAVPRTPMAV